MTIRAHSGSYHPPIFKTARMGKGINGAGPPNKYEIFRYGYFTHTFWYLSQIWLNLCLTQFHAVRHCCYSA